MPTKLSTVLLFPVFWHLLCHDATHGLYNAALFKPAYQSSTYSTNVASWGNDGNKDNIQHTLDENPSWWMVDLQGQYVVEQVIVKNTHEVQRLHTFQIDIFAYDPRTVTPPPGQICYQSQSSPGSGTFTWPCSTAITGRFVRLLRNGPDTLHINEMEVMVSRYTSKRTYFLKLPDKYLPGSPYAIFGPASPKSCAFRCAASTAPFCTAFNLYANAECQLLSVDPRGDLDRYTGGGGILGLIDYDN